MMRFTVVLVVLCCEPLTVRSEQEFPAPPPPVAPLPPPGPIVESPSRRHAAGGVIKPVPAPTIRLGEKDEIEKPYGHGAGFVDDGEFTVAAERGMLSAVLNTSAYSHSFYGAPSDSVASIRLVQEFDVIAGDPSQSMVVVSLAAKLRGTIRAERDEKATCALRLASASVAVPGGSALLSVAFPPFSRCGPISERYEGETSAGMLLLPPGHYVLVADLVAETTVESCLRGHAELLFAPPAEEGTWKSAITAPPKPKKGEEHRFGFIIVVTATPAPPG